MLLPVLKGYSDRKNDFIFENGAVYSESGFTGGSDGKKLPAMQETQVQILDGKIPWRKEWLPTQVFLLGEPHGQRNLQAMGSQRVGRD